MTSPEQRVFHIKAWQASGLSQAAYCRENGLNAKTFGNWMRTYRNTHKYHQPASLIPVTIKARVSAAGSLRLCCSGQHVLELPAEISPQWLGELLKCLN